MNDQKPLILCIAASLNHKGTTRSYVNHAYEEAIAASGGILLTYGGRNQWCLKQILQACHGVLLQGGQDIHPACYGEVPSIEVDRCDPVRDKMELLATEIAMTQCIPILGICRGMQIMNIALGGTLQQEMEEMLRRTTHHKIDEPRKQLAHHVQVSPMSHLAAIVDKDMIAVNSLHHQAIQRMGDGLRIAAQTEEIIEAVESPDHPFAVGVQWHPEEIMSEKHSVSLFEAFVSAAAVRMQLLQEHSVAAP